MRPYQAWCAALQDRLSCRAKLKQSCSRHPQRKVHYEPLEDRLAPAFDVTNLGLAAAGDGGVDGHSAVFTVSEAAQGIDLNGDGDTSDPVLQVYDSQTGVTTILGLAGRITRFNL
jgi:hypothetical protein